MEFAQLGETGVKVSRICLGCMSYGSADWRPWVLDEAAAKPFFARALEAGINFFDTANMYSLGRSEEITGKWLREMAKLDEVVIATKLFFPFSNKPNTGGLSRKAVQQACEASLRRLGVDCIDLYQIHRADPRTPVEETLCALNDLVQQGKVRYIGASSMYAYEFLHALRASDANGWARFVSMQNHYNLVYREEEREMLPLCESEGISCIPWSPLARGMLAGTRQQLGDSSTARSQSDGLDKILYDQPSDWPVVEAVRALAKARGCTPAQVALAWLLSRPTVAAPIIGATKMPHLEDAISALELKLNADEIAALEAPYQPHPVKGMPPAKPRRFRGHK